MKPLKKVYDGYERKYYRCKECKQVQAHDFIPYGLGRGVQWNPCYCQLTGHRSHLLEVVTAKEWREWEPKKVSKK